MSLSGLVIIVSGQLQQKWSDKGKAAKGSGPLMRKVWVRLLNLDPPKCWPKVREV